MLDDTGPDPVGEFWRIVHPLLNSFIDPDSLDLVPHTIQVPLPFCGRNKTEGFRTTGSVGGWGSAEGPTAGSEAC